MLEEGVLEKIDDFSFKMHFIDDLNGKRMPGEKWLKKIDNYETKDISTCYVNLQPNNGAKVIFTTLIIEYSSAIVDDDLMVAHKKAFLDFYNSILYQNR